MKWTVSKGVSDEVFVVRDHSILIDIAKLIDAINNMEVDFHILEIETETLLKFARSDMICKNTLSNMSSQRRDEPIVVTRFSDRSRVIDGSHRLAKRSIDGYAHCNAIAIEPHILSGYIEPFQF